MKVPCGEGRASHTGPESCGGVREGAGEALTGESAGRVLSRESEFASGCRRRHLARKATRSIALAGGTVLPSAFDDTVGTPKHTYFRGSIPGPHFPLSMLRLHPRGRLRMTRGRCGSLGLHRMELSSTTLCRFLPAHHHLGKSLRGTKRLPRAWLGPSISRWLNFFTAIPRRWLHKISKNAIYEATPAPKKGTGFIDGRQ